MKKIGYMAIAVGALACVGHTCCRHEAPPAPDDIKPLAKKLDNGCFYYAIGTRVILNRPLRVYPVEYYNAEPKFAGSVILRFSDPVSVGLFHGREYVELPAETEIFLGRFLVISSDGKDSSFAGDKESYFCYIDVPSLPALQSYLVYFMGTNGKILPFPWDSRGKMPMEKSFTPTEIEQLFPDGEWLPAELPSHRNL